jgi:Mg/Co/Ni transporter MgtE
MEMTDFQLGLLLLFTAFVAGFLCGFILGVVLMKRTLRWFAGSPLPAVLVSRGTSRLLRRER